MPRARNHVTLADVAHAAGVSPATVSRLMRGATGVNTDTRRLIEDAAKRLNFNLEGKQKTRIIAFLLSNRGVLHSFHSAVLVGAESYCAEQSYGLLFLPLTYSLSIQAPDLEIPEILLSTRIVAGAIVAGTNSPSMLNTLSRRRIPWVVLGNNVIGESTQNVAQAVFFDDIEGAREVSRYLISLGHQFIGFAGNLNMPWYLRRFKGYRDAMEEAGLSVRFSDLTSRDSEEMGYLATKMLLQQSPPVTAIFAGDDAAAYGVYKAAKDANLRIPEDLSVVGFNDTPEAATLDPALTSVRVFTHELGRQLAQVLISQLAHDRLSANVSMPTRLIRRGSCAPLSRS